jgi:hypothetical protein
MKERMARPHGWCLIGLIACFWLAACAGMNPQPTPEPAPEAPPPPAEITQPPPPPAEAPLPPQVFVHAVSLQGETLSAIAKWYTGSASNWRELAAANPDLDPNRIFLGNEIVIPEELLITHDPLPQSFLDKLKQSN